MSTATLNIWITKRGFPCEISPIEHNVYVLHCDGRILKWCGKKYVNLRTKCGHLELEIPPGCYVVGAVDWSPANPDAPYLGNNLTHIAIVRANCGDHICVTLFDPSLHFCGTWVGNALSTILHGGGGVPPRALTEVLQNANTAVNALVQALPPDGFVLNQAKAIGTTPPPADTPGAAANVPKGRAKKGR
jgi:hypothetical protein